VTDYGPTVIVRMTLLTFCLAVAACGGSAGSTSNSSTGVTPSPTKSAHVNSVDACTLVTASEASVASGSTVTNLSSGAQTPGFCIYGSSDSSTSVFVLAQVYPDETTADSISPEQMAAVLNGQMGVANAKAVQGIGDKAFEYTATSSSGGGIAIFVFKANVVLMIAVSPTSDSTKVEALARTAVGRF